MDRGAWKATVHGVLLHIIELNTIFQVLFRAICMSQFLWDSLVELIFVFFGGVKLFV